VLIPRPETEELVERVIAKLRSLRIKDKRLRIIDIGTGSGCIIISLAKMLSGNKYQFYASDISKKVLKIARLNARAHGAKIKFIHANLLEFVAMAFDIIVTNLPYGWKEWKNNTSAETAGLKFEPQEALFTEEKGLMLIHQLLEQIAVRKQKPKIVFLEFDPRQKTTLEKLIKKHLPKAGIKFYKDLNNLWRVAGISMP
jgi:release factor glutamine methyltransferase